MFKSMKEGLEVYKKAIEDYLIKCSEIEEIEKSSRKEDDYRGKIDWSKDSFEWEKKASNELTGMGKALGLSSEEWSRISREANEKLRQEKAKG